MVQRHWQSQGDIRVALEGVTLEGSLDVPPGAAGIVVFAHGSGSSRHSPRNRFVAGALRKGGLGTLLLDLLSEGEDQDYQQRFDIDLLTDRLRGATGWLETSANFTGLKIGYFGASTGAAAALKAASGEGSRIGAVVSRGGRPDLAWDVLSAVEAPTLFLVGEQDHPVLEWNVRSFERLGARVKDLAIIPGAGHLFEEPGALEDVARRATQWFKDHLSGP